MARKDSLPSVNGRYSPVASVNDVIAAPERPNESEDMARCKIPRSALLRVLQGVAVATKTSVDLITPIAQCISRLHMSGTNEVLKLDAEPRDLVPTKLGTDSFSLFEWCDALWDCINVDDRARDIVDLTISVAYMREHSRKTDCMPVDAQMMDSIWQMVYNVLTKSTVMPPLCYTVRSAQGFLSVPLCSLVEDGNIDELFKLHVWLPDTKRANANPQVHSHQPFAQSWILAGEGVDISYDVSPTTDMHAATHAEYAIAWSDGKTLSSTYKPHQTASKVVNTGKLVQAIPSQPAVHKRGMTYTIPASRFHASVVQPDILHATLFFFDSQRGYDRNATVLGPVDGESFVAHRDPAGITASTLAEMVQTVRSFEKLVDCGKKWVRQDDLDRATSTFQDAMQICDESSSAWDMSRYKYLASLELDLIERRRIEIVGRKRNKSRTQATVSSVDLMHVSDSIEIG